MPAAGGCINIERTRRTEKAHNKKKCFTYPTAAELPDALASTLNLVRAAFHDEELVWPRRSLTVQVNLATNF
jgi:hypothetical protein